jgi:hypothetical protein
MKKLIFKVGQTFGEITPESAENGEYSDQGWERETSTDWRLKDIIRAVEDQGLEHVECHGSHLTIYGWSHITCFKTCTERSLCLHVESSPRVISRLHRILIKPLHRVVSKPKKHEKWS